MKANGEFKGQVTIDTIKAKLQEELDTAEQEIYSEFGINEELAQEWLMKH
jgi:hypothetical protein